jgi:hypothetical protein
VVEGCWGSESMVLLNGAVQGPLLWFDSLVVAHQTVHFSCQPRPVWWPAASAVFMLVIHYLSKYTCHLMVVSRLPRPEVASQP